MAKFDDIDLSGLHRSIVAAKGGTLTASEAPAEPRPGVRRVYGRLLGVPVVGAGARKSVKALRKLKHRQSR
jgi:hypothetical protein